MFIPCSTAQEKNEVIKHLVSLGYKDKHTMDGFLNIIAYQDGIIQSVVDNKILKYEMVTPQQLLNKQEPTMNKLKEAVQNSGLNKSELSIRLGKSRNYIGEILRVGCSTKKQNELIEMINQIKAGERFKSDDEIIADLSEKLEKSQQLAQHNADCAHNYLAQLKEQQEISISNKECAESYLNELKNERKNAHNQAQRILELEAIIAPANKEIIELRATNAKYEDELTKAGEELLRQDELIQNKNEQIQRANDELILLNKENSELNKQRKSYMAAFFMLLSLVIVYALWSSFK